MIEEALDGEGTGGLVSETSEGARGRGVEIKVVLAKDEASLVETLAKAAGFRRSRWIAALVRRKIASRPVFAPEEAHSFILVQRELRRIGVNLNQVARALNAAVMPGSTLRAEISSVETARSEIRAHIAGLRAAFAGNLAYWDDVA